MSQQVSSEKTIAISLASQIAAIGFVLLAAFPDSLVTLLDNFFAHHLFSSDHVFIALVYTMVASWFVCATSILLSMILLKTNHFLFVPRVSIEDFSLTPKKLLWSFASGGPLAVGTFLIILASQTLDPTYVAILTSATMIWITTYDAIQANVRRWIILLIPIAIAGVGLSAFIGSFNPQELNLQNIVLVAGFASFALAVGETCGLKGTRSYTNSASFTLMHLIATALVTTVGTCIYAFVRNESSNFSDAILTTLQYWPWLLLLGFVAFFSVLFKMEGKMRLQISEVMLLLITPVFFVVIFQWIADKLGYDFFGQVPWDSSTWIPRILGFGCIIVVVICITIEILHNHQRKRSP